MTVRDLLYRLQHADPDARVELLDVSGRGLKLQITEGKWAVQVGDGVVFIRFDEAPVEHKGK